MKLKFNHAGVWVIGEFRVLPGVNELPGFEKHLTHPDVIEKQKTKNKDGHFILEIMEKPQAAKPGLAGLKEKEAIALVGETLNEKDLQQWHAEEKRPKVIKAIDEQLKKFAVGHREEKKEDKKE